MVCAFCGEGHSHTVHTSLAAANKELRKCEALLLRAQELFLKGDTASDIQGTTMILKWRNE